MHGFFLLFFTSLECLLFAAAFSCWRVEGSGCFIHVGCEEVLIVALN